MSFIDQLRAGRLAAYRAAPGDIQEHFGIEETVLAGGYGYRQVMELVQNGADAILEEQEENGVVSQNDRISVALDNGFLYVANTGASLSEDGIRALLQSHSSPKRGNQIGRFGIGFKSLLRLGGRIDIISRERSVRFDPQKASNLIRRELSLDESMPVPALRLAWGLDGDDERAADPRLAKFDWATTIVRAEIQNQAMLDHIGDEMERFPGAFLLFLPVPVRLVMDFGNGRTRCLERRIEGQESILIDGEDSTRWHVVERKVVVTDQGAINDARGLHARNEVPLAWAMPLDGRREEAGRFWAFFPTETPTRLPGILNGPWKLNSDRQSLIAGEWNRLLMEESAKMIAETLPNLSTDADPGKPLDGFPRRLERQDELASDLIDGVWKNLSEVATVPDGTATLRRAKELYRHPLNDAEIVEAWATLAEENVRKEYVHASAFSGNRTARLEELAKRISAMDDAEDFACLDEVNSAVWFSDIATPVAQKAKGVLALAEGYSRKRTQFQWHQERGDLEIIPTRLGSLCKVSNAIIAPGDTDIPGRWPVHDSLLDDAESLRILQDVLGIATLDNEKWNGLLRQALTGALNRKKFIPEECQKFWSALRAAPLEVGREFAKSNDQAIPLRRLDGNWRTRGAVLLPGTVVSADDEANGGLLLDGKFHEKDTVYLDWIGVAEFPIGAVGPGSLEEVAGEDSGLLSGWLEEARKKFADNPAIKRTPRKWHLKPKHFSLPAGWSFLRALSGKSQAKATHQLLEVAVSEPRFLAPVEFRHVTQSDVYPTIPTISPLAWLLCNYGSVEIFSCPVAIAAILRKSDDPILERVPQWPSLKSKLLKISDGIETESDKEQIGQFWGALLSGLVTVDTMAEPWLRGLWDSMADDRLVPTFLPSAEGKVPIAEAHFTTSRDLARHARDAGLVVAEVSVATGKIWQSMGAKGLDELFELEWEKGSEHDSLLVQAVPEVAGVLKEGTGEKAVCRSVSGLKTRFGESVGEVACVMWQGILHIDIGQLQMLSRSLRLGRILAEIENAGWLRCPADEAHQEISDSQVEGRRKHVADGTDLADRLLRATGGRTDVLLEVTGEAASSALAHEASPRQIAELALALLGPLVLQRIADCLTEEGLAPPGRWGTSESRLFVASLGFPEEFAASAGSKRDAELLVSGPIHLPELHDFQKEVVAGLAQLVKSGDGRRRAVVSLPTGGGKTRATVQAAVELILVPDTGRRSVLWIAQTDELCEQAVQAFRQVWANVGAQSTDLRVVRLWGGHRNPARSEETQPVAVIASIQTLTSRVGQEDLAWLSEPGLVVIDECHHAITKTYTGILRWLDAETPRGGTTPEKEPPVIGLSATPFRSSQDPEESQRLARRFDCRWLPANQEDLYRRLLVRGILAHADHEALKSEAQIPADLLSALENLDFDSIQADNIMEEINRRLAGDHDRNELLIDTIASSGASSILCFLNSVDHANEITARLCVRGITAAAVSGETPRSARRYFLSRFQSGEIRVLCNYLVLSTGFDAPKTDMLLISRQVMRPVRYMQMVGRGLRGPENGGTERCKIVTVMDNLGRFTGRHPYHYCARFFAQGTGYATQ